MKIVVSQYVNIDEDTWSSKSQEFPTMIEEDTTLALCAWYSRIDEYLLRLGFAKNSTIPNV